LLSWISLPSFERTKTLLSLTKAVHAPSGERSPRSASGCRCASSSVCSVLGLGPSGQSDSGPDLTPQPPSLGGKGESSSPFSASGRGWGWGCVTLATSAGGGVFEASVRVHS